MSEYTSIEYREDEKPCVLGEDALRKLSLGQRQFTARRELDRLVGDEMYRLSEACLSAKDHEVFAAVNLLSVLPPELWARLLDIENHRLGDLTSAHLELMRLDAPGLLDLEPEFGFTHPIQVVVTCDGEYVETVPYDGLFDDSRCESCISGWVMSNLGIDPERIARLVGAVMAPREPQSTAPRNAEPNKGVRTMVDEPAVKDEPVEPEPDYECDCTCFGSTCDNEWDDVCEFPWLRKEY